MDFPSGRSAARSRLPLGIVFLAAGMLAGCSSMTGGSGASGNAVTSTVFGAPNPNQQNAIVVNAENFGFDVNDCPPISVRPGTESIVTNLPGEKINPELGEKPTVLWQSSITDTARECQKTPEGVVVKVGIRGRVVGGPAAKAGTITIPVRLVIMKGSETVVKSELYKISVSLQEPNFASDFTKIDNSIVLPIAPGNTDYRIFVGFDEGGTKRSRR